MASFGRIFRGNLQIDPIKKIIQRKYKILHAGFLTQLIISGLRSSIGVYLRC